MDISVLSREQINEYCEEMLSHIPKDGSPKGNVSLKDELLSSTMRVWDDELYWSIRKLLINSHTLRLGRGKGGSVHIASPHHVGKRKNEANLYPGIKKCLEIWAQSQDFSDHIIVETAKQGRADTGGYYSRPDFACVAVRHNDFEFVSNTEVELITFEIESEERADVRAVYEALAQGRDATRAYVIFFFPEGDEAEAVYDKALEAATRHGVGLIVVTGLFKDDGWEEKLDPIKRVPQPELMDRFIKEQLKGRHKEIKAMLSRQGTSGISPSFVTSK